jgi:polysaccharide biosynthesis protein PslG
MRITQLTILLAILVSCRPAWGAESPLVAWASASPILPDGLGVNIHFTDAKPGEMKMLAEAGFRWVRMDLAWNDTERQQGRYDFSRYDHMMEGLTPYGIRALFILDYTNPLYDGGLSPYTDEGRKAFAQ